MPALVGSRCAGCEVTAYPADGSCPRCGRDTETVTLSTSGTLWTWTVQRYAPKSPPYVPPPEGFRPFAVGYVELPGEVKVESRLTECDPAVLVNGMEMELVIVPFRTDDDGNEVVTFAFRPVA